MKNNFFLFNIFIFIIFSLIESLILNLGFLYIFKIIIINFISLIIISIFKLERNNLIGTISYLLLISYSLTTPYFIYLNKNNYWWLRNVHNIDLKSEYINISLIYFSAILILLITNKLVRKLIKKIFFKKVKIVNDDLISNNMQAIKTQKSFSIYSFLNSIIKSNQFFFLLIFILIIIRFFMFNLDIGLTGLLPTQLPFKMTGILVRTINNVVPLILGYYLFKCKSRLKIILIFIFSIFNGMLASSKGVFLMPIIGLFFSIIYNYQIKRINAKKLFTSILSLLIITTFSLSLVISFKGNLVKGNNSGEIEKTNINNALNVVIENLQEKNISELYFFTKNMIVNRFDGIDNIAISSVYDPSQVKGGDGISRLSKLVNTKFFKDDVFDHHVQWIGNGNYPFGFYLGGALGSDFMILINENIFIFIMFAILLSLYAFILELFFGIQKIKDNNIRKILLTIISFIFIAELNSNLSIITFLIIFSFYRLRFKI